MIYSVEPLRVQARTPTYTKAKIDRTTRAKSIKGRRPGLITWRTRDIKFLSHSESDVGTRRRKCAINEERSWRVKDLQNNEDS